MESPENNFRTVQEKRVNGEQRCARLCVCVCVCERFDYCLSPYPIQTDAVQAKQSTVAGRRGWTGVGNSAGRASRLQFSLLNVNVPLCR